MMKNQKIYTSLLLISFILISNMLSAQILFDVFTNDTIKLTNKYLGERYYENAIFKEKIEITYFNIADANTPVLESINNELDAICLNYLNNEIQSKELYKELKKQLMVIGEMTNIQSNSYNNSNSYSSNYYELTSIGSSALSVIGDQLFCDVRFVFDLQYHNNYDSELTITHYYTANLKTGKIQRWENDMSKSQLALIQNKLSDKLNKQYSKMDSEYKYTAFDEYRIQQEELEEWEENEEELSKEKEEALKNEDVCSRIDFSEASIFWFAWGIIIEFQDYTNSSKIYYGTGFQIFLPFDEAKEVFGAIPKFSFLNSITVPETELRDHNALKAMERINLMQKAPSIDDLFVLNRIAQKPKSLQSLNQTIAENGYVSKPLKAIYRFNEAGQVLNIKIRIDSILVSEKSYEYNAKGAITAYIWISDNQLENKINYTYNNYGNLIEKISAYDDDSEVLHFFYNGASVYYFSSIYSYYDARRVQGINKVYFGKNEIIGYNNRYILNENGDVIGVDSRELLYQKQIGRDSLGRIVEVHSEYDRYNDYWTYDSLGRLVSYQDKNQKINYYYKVDSMLPFKSENPFKRSVDTYKWEF